MTDSVGYVAAFGGGVASFVSPCVLPIVPGYLSVITGLDLADPNPGSSRHLTRVARDTGLFIGGFTVVFVLLGITATTVGGIVFRNKVLLLRVSGALVIAMALFLLGSLVLKLPGLYREARFTPDVAKFGPFAAPVAGAAFGFGWTPCLGPILTSVLALAATTGGAAHGATLLVAYSLGLGVPFLIMGLALGKLSGPLKFVRRHSVGLTLISVVFLLGFGLLLFFDRLTWVTSELEQFLRAVGLGRLVDVG